MRTALITLVTSTLLMLSGCTTYLHIESDPEGAMITDSSGTVVYGYAPVSVGFDRDTLEASAEPGHCPQVPGFVARWPSGAQAATATSLDVCDPTHGLTLLLKRPAEAPNLERDLSWALERAQARARQAEAERDLLRLHMDRPWVGPYWMRPWPPMP